MLTNRRQHKGLIMAIRGSAQSITEKWAQRTSGATQQVIEGVARVQQAPGVKAAQQKNVWLQNIQAKADKWENNVKAVSLQSWQQATTQGAQRIAAGVNAKKGKMESFLNEFLPYVEQVQRRVEAMPRGSLDQNLLRMVENARQLSQFKRTGQR